MRVDGVTLLQTGLIILSGLHYHRVTALSFVTTENREHTTNTSKVQDVLSARGKQKTNQSLIVISLMSFVAKRKAKCLFSHLGSQY